MVPPFHCGPILPWPLFLIIVKKNTATLPENSQNEIKWDMCHQLASLAFRFYKIQFRLGLRPGPRWGSLFMTHSQTTYIVVGWGGENPLPIPHPLDAYSILLLTLGIKAQATWHRACQKFLSPIFSYDGNRTLPVKLCQITHYMLNRTTECTQLKNSHTRFSSSGITHFSLPHWEPSSLPSLSEDSDAEEPLSLCTERTLISSSLSMAMYSMLSRASSSCEMPLSNVSLYGEEDDLVADLEPFGQHLETSFGFANPHLLLMLSAWLTTATHYQSQFGCANSRNSVAHF